MCACACACTAGVRARVRATCGRGKDTPADMMWPNICWWMLAFAFDSSRGLRGTHTCSTPPTSRPTSNQEPWVNSTQAITHTYIHAHAREHASAVHRTKLLAILSSGLHAPCLASEPLLWLPVDPLVVLAHTHTHNVGRMRHKSPAHKHLYKHLNIQSTCGLSDKVDQHKGQHRIALNNHLNLQ